MICYNGDLILTAGSLGQGEDVDDPLAALEALKTAGAHCNTTKHGGLIHLSSLDCCGFTTYA